MILAIDIGNTHVVIGCLDEEDTRFIARVATDQKKTEDEYAMMLLDLFQIHKLDGSQIEGAIMCSVVPGLTTALRRAVKLILGYEPLLVGSGIKTGLNIKMDNPASVGSDLIVAAVAAVQEHQPPLIIFDMGTANTMVVIDRNGDFIGGMIIPGAILSLEALAEHAAKLPHVSFEAPKTLIGKNTIDSMKSGIVYSQAMAVDGIIGLVEEELGEPVTVLATGGSSRLITSYCKREMIYDSRLIQKGLLHLYRKNTNQ